VDGFFATISMQVRLVLAGLERDGARLDRRRGADVA
jgi:hypothetical protein